MLSSQVPRVMSLIFNWKPQEASTPTNAIASPGRRLGTLPFPRDRRAHPRAQPPRTPGSPGAHTRTAAAAAPSPGCAHRAADFLLRLLLLVLRRPATRAGLLSAPGPDAGRKWGVLQGVMAEGTVLYSEHFKLERNSGVFKYFKYLNKI